jgi:pSer/pThr/pTyr-binding forkhead associated (FHA) protein
MSEIVATLTIEGPDGAARTHPLKDGDILRAGRAEGADLRLNDPSVSRAHCMFSASASGVVVCDLSSTNGTYVNGALISTPVDLQPSDVVDVGPFKFGVVVVSAEAANNTSAAGRTMTAHLKPVQTVVMVARLRGVRGLEASQPEGALLPHLEKWRGIVSASVTACGGKADKMLHECIVAVWYGADAAKLSREAVRAAQQIDVQTRQYSVCGGWPLHNQHPLTCSIVLNTGFALTGSVGGKSGPRAFVVLGDTVNTAFKLAELTEVLAQSVFASEDVARTLQSVVRMQKVGSISDEKQGEVINLFALQP